MAFSKGDKVKIISVIGGRPDRGVVTKLLGDGRVMVKMPFALDPWPYLESDLEKG